MTGIDMRNRLEPRPHRWTVYRAAAEAEAIMRGLARLWWPVDRTARFLKIEIDPERSAWWKE